MKPRNPHARALHTPLYRPRVVENKRKQYVRKPKHPKREDD